MLRSPNGEDVLYVFYDAVAGRLGLFGYNLIDKQLSAPLYSNGYARFDDGRILLFVAEGSEPTRIHPMQLWQTPFCSEEHAGRSAAGQGFFGRIGNSELVRGLSELYAIARAVREQAATRLVYEDLIKHCGRVLDGYFWLDSAEAGQLAAELKAIGDTARATLDEFDKVESIRHEAAKALLHAETGQKTLFTEIASRLWHSPGDFVTALDQLRGQRGKLLALKELRYIDLERIGALDAELETEQQRLSDKTVRFLAQDDAFKSYRGELEKIGPQLAQAQKTNDIDPLQQTLDEVSRGLDLLTELLGTLASGDAGLRTRILDAVSGVYAEVNRLRAEARNRRKQLGETEAAAEFGAQFKLFGQSVANALEFADTPEKCDEALTRLLTQLEELEGRFGEQEAFLADIAGKRETVYEAFASRKQVLLDERQRRAQALFDAASRILAGIPKRVAQLAAPEQLHAYFASDALILKLKGQINNLRALGSAVHADDLEAQLKTARENATKILRDRAELMSGEGIRLGKHRFTVNTQPLDLTIVPKDSGLVFHLTGTDYFEAINDSRLEALRDYWPQTLVAETDTVYRAEYLAYSLWDAAQRGDAGLDVAQLRKAAIEPAQLTDLVRQFAATRYQEGYQKGVHDHDATLILAALLPMAEDAGLLRFAPLPRALAALFWCHVTDYDESRQQWKRQAVSAARLAEQFGHHEARKQLECVLADKLDAFVTGNDLLPSALPPTQLAAAAAYLVAELAGGRDEWCASAMALDLADGLSKHLERHNLQAEWRDSISHGPLAARWSLAQAWLSGYAARQLPQAADFVAEAAALLLA